MSDLTPTTVLENETPVQIVNRRGVVVGHRESRDQCGEPIIVHTVRITHKLVYGVAGKRKSAPCDPYTEEVNYSFLQLL